MSRRINLNTFVVPDPQLCGWFEANGINPGTVPINQEVLVDGDQLTYVAFVQEDGHNVQDPTTSERRWLKELRTVTLVSAPEDHNL